MKTENIQQEILIFTSTTFSQREWSEINASGKDGNAGSAQEQLEKACWNGMLEAMFPEIINTSVPGVNVFVQEVNTCESCLSIELATWHQPLEPEFSINPYLFTFCFQ